jgi:hypothetical protein
MARPNTSQQLVLRARKTGDIPRIASPRVTCPRCQQEAYAGPDGLPRPHLRPAVQGDMGFSELVPVRVGCEDD